MPCTEEELVQRRSTIQPNEATLAALGKSSSPSLPQNGTSTARPERDTSSDPVKKEEDASMSSAEGVKTETTDGKEKEKDEVKPVNPEVIVLPAKPEQICVARVPPEVGIKELEEVRLSLFSSFPPVRSRS
jgi:hypothetical protein